MICPYAFDTAGWRPGARRRTRSGLHRARPHRERARPRGDGVDLPDYVVSVGAALAIPYNGSVSRVAFGPEAYRRLRTWLRDGEFDVLHVHEPKRPEHLDAVADGRAGPDRHHVPHLHDEVVVAQHLSGHPAAVSRADRRQDRRLRTRPSMADGVARVRRGGDPQRDPRVGVSPTPVRSTGTPREGHTILFLGRYDEPRKGIDVLMRALPSIVAAIPDVRVLVVGTDTNAHCDGAPVLCRTTSSSWGRWTTRRRPARWRPPTSTSPPTSAVRASASSSSRRWRRVRQWSPAISTPSVVFSTTGAPDDWCAPGNRPRCRRPSSTCSATTTPAPRWWRLPTRWRCDTTGPVIADRILQVYETVVVGADPVFVSD